MEMAKGLCHNQNLSMDHWLRLKILRPIFGDVFGGPKSSVQINAILRSYMKGKESKSLLKTIQLLMIVDS